MRDFWIALVLTFWAEMGDKTQLVGPGLRDALSGAARSPGYFLGDGGGSSGARRVRQSDWRLGPPFLSGGWYAVQAIAAFR